MFVAVFIVPQGQSGGIARGQHQDFGFRTRLGPGWPIRVNAERGKILRFEFDEFPVFIEHFFAQNINTQVELVLEGIFLEILRQRPLRLN